MLRRRRKNKTNKQRAYIQSADDAMYRFIANLAFRERRAIPQTETSITPFWLARSEIPRERFPSGLYKLYIYI
jgi:hypothetical protein